MSDAADLIPLQELHKFSSGPIAQPVLQSNFPVVAPPGHVTQQFQQFQQFQPLLARPAVSQHQQSR